MDKQRTCTFSQKPGVPHNFAKFGQNEHTWTFISLLAIIAKYDILIKKWDVLYYALLEVFMNKIALWKYVQVDDWTVELVAIASNKTLWVFRTTIQFSVFVIICAANNRFRQIQYILTQRQTESPTEIETNTV